MKTFDNFRDFSRHLQAIAGAQAAALALALADSAKTIEAAAKAEIGHYQAAEGPFQAWPELADSTKTERRRLGFTENDPGLRTGAMRDSISHHVAGLEAVVGSDDQHLVWFELGTEKQPPRSVLGLAAIRHEHQIKQIVGRAAWPVAG